MATTTSIYFPKHESVRQLEHSTPRYELGWACLCASGQVHICSMGSTAGSRLKGKQILGLIFLMVITGP